MMSGYRQNIMLSSVERMLNKVLSLDETSLISLGELVGKVVEIDIVHTEIKLFIFVSAQGIKLASEYTGDVDVSIKGTPSALFGMMNAEKAGVDPIEIKGDIIFAQKFQSILKKMEVDWEEYLSQIIGDIAAHKMANLLRGMSQLMGASVRTIGLDISEYLRYEKELLLDKSELDTFNHAVDVIRDDVERLAKHVERLRKERT